MHSTPCKLCDAQLLMHSWGSGTHIDGRRKSKDIESKALAKRCFEEKCDDITSFISWNTDNVFTRQLWKLLECETEDNQEAIVKKKTFLFQSSHSANDCYLENNNSIWQLH